MKGKEFVVDVLRTYFLIVTLINVVMLVLGTAVFPDVRFGYEAFSAPLLYGAAGVLPNIVMYSKRELNVKELIVRKAVQFVLIEFVVLLVVADSMNGFWQQPQLVAALMACVLVIYVISCIIEMVQNTADAKKINAELMKFQQDAAE